MPDSVPDGDDAGATVLAVDVGTSSLKAVLFGRDGSALGQVIEEYPVHGGPDGRREQDPEDWWRALVAAAAVLVPGRTVAAITLAGTMQNVVAMRGGRARGRAILYSDPGPSPSAQAALRERLPADFEGRIGNRPDGAMPLFRFMAGDPRMPRDAALRYHFGAKDVMAERLTGRAAIDPCTATTTGLFAMAARRWDPDLLAACGLAADQLPAVLPADATLGRLTAEAAAALGLPEATPVVTGSGDAGAATWGAGGGAPGRAYAYLGTSGWVAATLHPEPAATRDSYTLVAPVGAACIAIAPMLQAGAALDWVARLGGSAEAAAAVDPVPPAALFLPYLGGERSPFEDRDVRAGFLGLDERTDPAALRYAALEGLAHAVRDNLEASGLRPASLPLIGGLAEDPVLRLLLADTLDLPVEVGAHPRLATAFGAFLFAADALGWPRPSICDPAVRTLPRAGRRERAERRFAAFRAARDVARRVAADLLVRVDGQELGGDRG